MLCEILERLVSFLAAVKEGRELLPSSRLLYLSHCVSICFIDPDYEVRKGCMDRWIDGYIDRQRDG